MIVLSSRARSKATGPADLRLYGDVPDLVLFHYSAEHPCGPPVIEVRNAAEPLSAVRRSLGLICRRPLRVHESLLESLVISFRVRVLRVVVDEVVNAL